MPSKIEIKTYRAELKADSAKRQIAGHCSIFGNVDSYGDVVMPGAFAKSIAERGSVAAFFNHEWVSNPAASPIGHTSLLAEDSIGLEYVIDVAPTEKGDETLALVEHGTIKASSFGFNIAQGGSERIPRDEEGKRRLLEIDIFEVSPVVWPANTQADAELVKARALFGEAKANLENLGYALQLLARAREIITAAIEVSVAESDGWVADVEATDEAITAFDAELSAFLDWVLTVE